MVEVKRGKRKNEKEKEVEALCDELPEPPTKKESAKALFGPHVIMVGKPVFWVIVALFTLSICFIYSLMYMLGGYYHNPADMTICECDCTNDVTCASYKQDKASYIHNNILPAHSIFNPYPFMAQSEYSGYLDGYSMQPTFYEGNIMLFKNITKEYKLKPGEIVRYTTVSYDQCQSLVPLNRESPYTIHRIKAIYGTNEIHIQGDNNQHAEVIRRCQISHIVVGVLFQ